MANSGDELPDVAGILADRLAAVLVHHEPGWRLPRLSTLARRYNVRPAQVEQAIRELAARHLIRQLPDGQLYRASPAEYLIEVPGVPRLGSPLDPMGTEVICRNRKVSWRRAPEDVSWALGLAQAESVCAVKCHWSMNGEPAAISTTYLTREAVGQVSDAVDVITESAAGEGPLSGPQWGSSQRDPQAPQASQPPLGVPAALRLEMQPPPSSVARGLRLGPGQPAVMVTVRYDDPRSHQPIALTVAALRPEQFRIVIESPADSAPFRVGTSAEALDDDVASTQGDPDGAGEAGEDAAGQATAADRGFGGVTAAGQHGEGVRASA